MTNRPAKRPPSAAALPALLLALAAAGCGGDPSRVLARVGNRALTVDEFFEVGRGNEAQYPGSPDSAKAMLLEDMIRRALVLCDAERLGIHREPGVATSRERFANEEAQQALVRRLIPQDVRVSEAEIERLHAWRDTAVHARAILCASRSHAEVALSELARGADFGEIADRFNLPGTLPPGGDLGYLLPGTLVSALDRPLREAPVMAVTGPVESPGDGWFLLQVLDRQKREQKPLDEQRAVLRNMLRQRKTYALRMRAQRALSEAYQLRLEPGGAQALFHYFNRVVGTNTETQAAPTEAERATVLARYDAGGTPAVYTMGDAVTDLQDYGRERPNPSMLPSIERWIELSAYRRLVLIEARRRRLDQEADVMRRIDRRTDNAVLDLYYDVEIAHGGEATSEDLREAYERNAGIHQRLDSVDLLVATLPDSATAEALIAHAGHAPSLREAVAMASPGAPVIAERVPFPGAPERWSSYREAFMQMSPRECMGPFPAAGGWRVAQLVSKDQRPIPLDQLAPEIYQSLQREAEEIRRDRTFQAKTEALRREFRPEVNAARLRALPWPIPGPESPG